MVKQTELEWRQKKLDKMIAKYLKGVYTDYYIDMNGKVIVFVTELKTKIKKTCVCLEGLDCALDQKLENKKSVVYEFENMNKSDEL
tara:strand:+ start:463 stop:720 length:258 start_codon:yes stop_codon:yes gene_type:complete